MCLHTQTTRDTPRDKKYAKKSMSNFRICSAGAEGGGGGGGVQIKNNNIEGTP